MCDHKIYRRRVVEALGRLGGSAGLLELVDCLAGQYKVPEGEAYIAIIDAAGVTLDHMEGIVSLDGRADAADPSSSELALV